MSARRRDDGTQRFLSSAYSDDDLVEVVTTIVRRLVDAGTHPDDITAGQLDETLKKSVWFDAPKTDRWTRRLGMPIRRIVEIAADPSRSLLHNRGAASRTTGRNPDLPEVEEANYALRLVADHLGTDRLNRRTYRLGRESVLGPKKLRARVRTLPAEETIAKTAGNSFPAAVLRAGLIHDDGNKHDGLPNETVVEQFLELVGCLPWSSVATDAFRAQRDARAIPATSESRSPQRWRGTRSREPRD